MIFRYMESAEKLRQVEQGFSSMFQGTPLWKIINYLATNEEKPNSPSNFQNPKFHLFKPDPSLKGCIPY